MATVVHKDTFQELPSVNTPDYPTTDWLINPAGLSVLKTAGVPIKHWKLIGPRETAVDLEEMTQAEKDALVVTDFPSVQAAKVSQMGAEVTAFIYARYDSEAQSTLESMYSRAETTGKTNRRDYIGFALDWVENLLTYFYAREDAILETTDQTELDAEAWDFNPYDAAADPGTNADPEVSIKAALAIFD